MKIVIEIPDKIYDGIKKRFPNYLSYLDVSVMANAILNGTILPKGHGRLIDADALKLTKHDIYVEAINYRHRCISVENIDEAPTIIEADKEGATDGTTMDK